MKKLLQQIFLTATALTMVSYTTAIVLACQKNPTPQQIYLIHALTETAQTGCETIFQLLSPTLPLPPSLPAPRFRPPTSQFPIAIAVSPNPVPHARVFTIQSDWVWNPKLR